MLVACSKAVCTGLLTSRPHNPAMRKNEPSKAGPTKTPWQTLPDDLQAALAQQAMRRAALIIAEQAELFAMQFNGGMLQDRGANDGLRLFAALLRETTIETLAPAGHA